MSPVLWLYFFFRGGTAAIEPPCVTLTQVANPSATLTWNNPSATLTQVENPSVTLTKVGC